MARTDAVNEGVDPCTALTPDLLSQRFVARGAIGVRQLIRPKCVWLATQAAGFGNHLRDQLLRDATAIARHQSQLGAQGLHLYELLSAEGVGADNPQWVT